MHCFLFIDADVYEMMSTVSDLLTDSGIWNVELIKNCFLHIDAEAILKQPAHRPGWSGFLGMGSEEDRSLFGAVGIWAPIHEEGGRSTRSTTQQL